MRVQKAETTPSGLILLNKKAGITSFDALGDIKRALGTGKVGHTGTLDKFARGLMIVLAGRALKLSSLFSGCDKKYEGRICFGVETETLDPEGKVTGEAAVPERSFVEQVLCQFTGKIMQAPPAYSAIHINGRRASELARSGKAPEMKQRPVHIYKLELRSWAPPFADIFVHCSSGTYIRSLARDIALATGSRAHLSALLRTQIANFTLDMAEALFPNEAMPHPYSPLPIDKTVIDALGLPWYEIDNREAEMLIHGKPLAPILDGKPLNQPSLIKSDAACSAAVFSGETLAAIVEKIDGNWKYGCVM
jgi:tRNA pseudouridine55 synthase